MSERSTFQPVPPESVCQTYELLHNNGLVSFPITAEGRRKVEAIVANITGTYYGRPLYSSPQEKAAAYLYFLIKDHPFTDGNKRTATLVFSVVCDINTLFPRFDNRNPTLDELAVFIESIQEEAHQRVIREIIDLLLLK